MNLSTRRTLLAAAASSLMLVGLTINLSATAQAWPAKPIRIGPSVYAKLNFDPGKDLRGVGMLAYSPHLLVVQPSVPANNQGELVALSKITPLNFAVTAMGSVPHLAGVAVELASGAKWAAVVAQSGVKLD